MREVKKIKLTDSPTCKDVKKIRLEPLRNEDHENYKYDIYENSSCEIYVPKRLIENKQEELNG